VSQLIGVPAEPGEGGRHDALARDRAATLIGPAGRRCCERYEPALPSRTRRDRMPVAGTHDVALPEMLTSLVLF
jgi:hypothetical protein